MGNVTATSAWSSLGDRSPGETVFLRLEDYLCADNADLSIEKVKQTIHQALLAYHRSRSLSKRIDMRVEETAREWSSRLMEEALRDRPKLTPEEMRVAARVEVNTYHRSVQLRQKIDKIAEETAERVADRKIAETVRALPRLGGDDIKAAVREVLTAYHKSPHLRDRILHVAREAAEEGRRDLGKTLADIEERARRSAEEIAGAKIEEILRQRMEEMEQSLREGLESFLRSQALTSRVEELVRSMAGQELEGYHDSRRLEELIDRRARRVAEVAIFSATMNGLHDLIDGRARRTVEEFFRSGQLRDLLRELLQECKEPVREAPPQHKIKDER